jgi:dTDP-4-dehydrorhamnose 3,5-epimerase
MNYTTSFQEAGRLKVVETELPGVLIIEPDVHRDGRGFFLETYHLRKYAEHGIADRFVQDNHSYSTRGTLRGLHAQRERPQAKLVRAVEGQMFDVAVDIRRGAPTFKKWVGVTLTGDNFRQLYIPPGFAHGFCVLSERVHVEYKCTDFYDASDEIRIAWNDPEIGIDWPIASPIVSARDESAPRLAAILDLLPLLPRPVSTPEG